MIQVWEQSPALRDNHGSVGQRTVRRRFRATSSRGLSCSGRKRPPPHLQKGWRRTHIVNSSRPGTFKRPGAGVAIRAPATQTMPPVAGEG